MIPWKNLWFFSRFYMPPFTSPPAKKSRWSLWYTFPKIRYTLSKDIVFVLPFLKILHYFLDIVRFDIKLFNYAVPNFTDGWRIDFWFFKINYIHQSFLMTYQYIWWCIKNTHAGFYYFFCGQHRWQRTFQGGHRFCHFCTY